MAVGVSVTKFWQWLAGILTRREPTAEKAHDRLRIARHLGLCTALPFPKLCWDGKHDVENLKELHDYAVQLANSNIDWYLEKKSAKKFYAKTLHYSTYTFGVLAATVPLLKIFNTQVETGFVRWLFGEGVTNPSALTAELALVLIGIAGGLNLIDRYAGLTDAWMRYITTATRLNRALIAYQFEWNELERSTPRGSTASGSPPTSGEDAPKSLPTAPTESIGGGTRGKKAPTDSVTERIELVKRFCLAVIDIIGEETLVWADELKERVAQIARNFPAHGKS
jgi:hypothetical protein